MQTVLAVLSEELRRLKAAGVESLAVSDESLAALKRAANRLAPPRGEGRGGSPSRPSPPPTPTSATVAVASERRPYPQPPPIALPSGSKAERFAALLAAVRADENCRSHLRPGKKVVLGVGNLDARIMFVGEAPGAEEEIQGEPFVGPAGQLLNRMIGATGLQRSDVYIGNIMNWRPELPTDAGGVQYGNRPPTPEEMAYCLPYLRAQIEIVRPEFLVALGSSAAQGLLGAGAFRTLGEVRGQWRDFEGRPLLVTYHPSYILRNPTNRSKRLIWEDFLRVMDRAGLPVSDRQRGHFLEK